MTQMGHCAQGISPSAEVLTDDCIHLVLVFTSAPSPLFCTIHSPAPLEAEEEKKREPFRNDTALRKHHAKMIRE